MNASYESSRVNLESGTLELDLLVNLARKLPGVLGARLTGAGLAVQPSHFASFRTQKLSPVNYHIVI